MRHTNMAIYCQLPMSPTHWRRDSSRSHQLAWPPFVVLTILGRLQEHLLSELDRRDARFWGQSFVHSMAKDQRIEIAYIAMRVIVGATFACHGAQKLFGVLGA